MGLELEVGTKTRRASQSTGLQQLFQTEREAGFGPDSRSNRVPTYYTTCRSQKRTRRARKIKRTATEFGNQTAKTLLRNRTYHTTTPTLIDLTHPDNNTSLNICCPLVLSDLPTPRPVTKVWNCRKRASSRGPLRTCGVRSVGFLHRRHALGLRISAATL